MTVPVFSREVRRTKGVIALRKETNDIPVSRSEEWAQVKDRDQREKTEGGGLRSDVRKGRIMKKWPILLCLGVYVFIFCAPLSGYAVENSPRITDREIIESLIRLEEGVKANREMIIALRTEMGSLRTEMGSLRTEIYSGIKSLRDEVLGFLKWGFGLLFTGMLILVGFILWDRRSTLKPIKDDLDKLERRKVDRLLEAMRKLSEEDSRVAQVLRSVGLL